MGERGGGVREGGEKEREREGGSEGVRRERKRERERGGGPNKDKGMNGFAIFAAKPVNKMTNQLSQILSL